MNSVEVSLIYSIKYIVLFYFCCQKSKFSYIKQCVAYEEAITTSDHVLMDVPCRLVHILEVAINMKTPF